MEPFVGQIMTVGFTFAPAGWAMCAGQLLPINQNQALFALLGTIYGGNGITTFGLPDLRGRAAIGMGQGPGLTNIVQGQLLGTENVTMLVQNLPPHNHPLAVSTSAGTLQTPAAGASLAQSNQRDAQYVAVGEQGTQVPLGGATSVGGGVPISIVQPSIGLNYIIALVGIFPSRP